MERRNVTDYYQDWATDAIKADLDEHRHNFSVLASNIHGDFNIGTIIRNCNAFLGQRVYIYRKNRQWDRRGAVGTQHYEQLRIIKRIEEVTDEIRQATVIGIDNIEGAVPIETFEWPFDTHIIMAFGEEVGGLPPEILDICDKIVYIKQYGSVRSLNAGVASGIAMYDYIQKLGTSHV